MASPIERNPVGPLRYADLIRIKEVLFFDKTRPPPIEPRDDDVDHIIRQLDRYDFLAHEKLEDDALGHLILERNDMRLWPNDFVPGLRIKIPTRASLTERGFI